MKIIAPLYILFFLSLIPTGQAAELTKEFNTQDGFTIHLPKNWVQIPNEVLRQVFERISQLAPKAEKQTWDYGFQLNQNGYWMRYPYILIQVKRVGRISEAELKKSINEEFSKEKDKLSSTTSNAQLRETVYDSKNKILWTIISANVKGTGIVNGQCAFKLTDFGIIKVMGYAKANTFSTYQPIFQEIAKQINLDKSINYKAQKEDTPWLSPGPNNSLTYRFLVAGTGGAIITGIFGLIIIILKKIKKKRL